MDKMRAIKCFCRIVETNSFVAAARELEMVPSVLSKAIASLEADIGFKLFNRTTRRVAVTENGANYYERCKRFVTELDEAERNMRDGMNRVAGRLLVGLHPAVSRLLMSRITEFTSAHPDVVVETTLTSTISTLLDDRLEVLVTLGSPTNSALGVQSLGSTRHILVASPAYTARHGVPQNPHELRSHTFVVSGRPDGPLYARWALRRGSETEVVFVAAKIVNRQGIHLQDACLAGAGIGRLAAISVHHYIRDAALVPVLPEWSLGDYPIQAVFPTPKNISARARAFVKFARSVIAAQPDTRGHPAGRPR